MSWHRVAEAIELPVKLDDAKAQVRGSYDDEDALLDMHLSAAHDLISEQVGFPLGLEVWCASMTARESLPVPLYPVAELVSVMQGGVALLGFTLVRDGDQASIVGPFPASAVEIRVKVGGFAPPALRQAVLLVAGLYFDHRKAAEEKPMTALPFAVESLVSLYRRGWAKA